MGSTFSKVLPLMVQKAKGPKQKIHKELPWLDITETPEEEEHNVPA